MDRVFFHYKYWEESDCDFHNNAGKSATEAFRNDILFVLADVGNCEKYMEKVLSEWKNSCIHNLTNPSLNKVAWLGQSACSIYNKVPATATMSTWSSIDKTDRDNADEIAKRLIKAWEFDYEKTIRN